MNKLRAEFNNTIRKKYIETHPYCEYCNDNETLAEQVHHIIPLGKGGDNRESNLFSLCLKCHGLIHDNYNEEWKKRHREGIERAKKAGKFKGGQGGYHGGGFSSSAVFCVTTQEYFSTMAEAKEKYNIDTSNISKNCRGIIKSAGKHPITNEKMIWEYYKK